MHKSKHLAAVVHLRAHLLELAAQQHVIVQVLGHLRGDGGLGDSSTAGVLLGGGGHGPHTQGSPGKRVQK
jgi:hypothetical protein